MTVHRPDDAKPRVFVSSVVKGFEEFREAARAAIVASGGEPVLANEDFPSLAASSRNVCLDAVASCDYLLSIVGSRGGWRAPSGKLVVEEEFEEAQRRKIPVLVFVQEGVMRDADAVAFETSLSDYVSGSFRMTFSNPADLRRVIEKSLQAVLPAQNTHSMPVPSRDYFSSPYKVQNEAMLRFVLTPQRNEEIVDPVRLASDDFRHRVLELGHSRSVGLFNYEDSKAAKLERDALRIEQSPSDGRHGEGRHVLLHIRESGELVIDANVTGRRARGNSFPSALQFVVAVEDIEAVLRACFAFSAAFYNDIDRFDRQQTFLYNAALSGLGYRQLERNPQPRSSSTIAMRSEQQVIVAHEEPRRVTRNELSSPEAEINRTILRFVQKSAS